MFYENLVFEDNNSGNFINSIEQLVQLNDINVKCNNIIIIHEINVIYNKNTIYIPIDRQYDIIFNINNIDNDHIIKKELFGGEFNKICDIDFNIDFILPIYMIQYTPIYVKITFDNIINIPNNIKLTFTGGLLQKEYRNNINIIYPLNNYIHKGEIMVHAPDISNFNIMERSF